MARIKHRKRADGGVSHQVCWVEGGGRSSAGVREQAETFTNLNRAHVFKLDVERAGNHWPDGWVKGEGYVDRDDRAGPPTVGDVAARFWSALDRRVQRGRLKAYTLHRYKRVWVLHLESTFAGMPFPEVTVADVEDWIDTEIDDGASAKSIRNWHGVLHSLMAYGQQHELLRADNPCTATELPEVDHRSARQVRFFTENEWAILRAALKADIVLLCDYLLATGLRWGEVSALRVSDLTVNGSEVVAHVVRAWSSRSPDDSDPIDRAAGEAKVWKLGPPRTGDPVTSSSVVTLRPSLPSPAATDVGYVLGRSRGVSCWASVEDSMILLGPPRSGKGLHTVIRMILDAPGAVVTTSTRPDNLTATLHARAKIGPVAVFDPQGIAYGVPSATKWSRCAAARTRRPR